MGLSRVASSSHHGRHEDCYQSHQRTDPSLPALPGCVKMHDTRTHVSGALPRPPSAPSPSGLEIWGVQDIYRPFFFSLCRKSESPLQQSCWQSVLRKELMKDTSDPLLLRSWRGRLGYHLFITVYVGSYSNTETPASKVNCQPRSPCDITSCSGSDLDPDWNT